MNKEKTVYLLSLDIYFSYQVYTEETRPIDSFNATLFYCYIFNIIFLPLFDTNVFNELYIVLVLTLFSYYYYNVLIF